MPCGDIRRRVYINENKMNVIGLTAQASGCGFHRVILPVAFMNDIKGYVTNVITEDRSKGWDILLYNRISVYDKH